MKSQRHLDSGGAVARLDERIVDIDFAYAFIRELGKSQHPCGKHSYMAE